ncbi:MAG: hypothetical protein MUD12_11145 [Spirochaetes bacterium]|nr:hypothetical protein [Spirochaetota bacterium]
MLERLGDYGSEDKCLDKVRIDIAQQAAPAVNAGDDLTARGVDDPHASPRRRNEPPALGFLCRPRGDNHHAVLAFAQAVARDLGHDVEITENRRRLQVEPLADPSVKFIKLQVPANRIGRDVEYTVARGDGEREPLAGLRQRRSVFIRGQETAGVRGRQ